MRCKICHMHSMVCRVDPRPGAEIAVAREPVIMGQAALLFGTRSHDRPNSSYVRQCTKDQHRESWATSLHAQIGNPASRW